jgi:D-lactate dehydrogenase
VLAQLPNLKMITTRSTGFDHIDLDYCSEHGITVCNVPTYGDNTVAEHVFALLLALSHRVVHAVDRTRKGDFSFEGLCGFDLRGKTIDIIGTGNIGRCVVKIAKGFDMHVVAVDTDPDEEFAEHAGIEYVGLDDLLAQADIVTLHVPGNKTTHHLLSSDEFATLKEGAVVINTSRGTVVDVLALQHALAEGKVSAAGLDVLPEEPIIREEAELLRTVFNKQHDVRNLLADHILLHMDNVLITPHTAFNTHEAVQRIIDVTCENITAFPEGKPQNVINLSTEG